MTYIAGAGLACFQPSQYRVARIAFIELSRGAISLTPRRSLSIQDCPARSCGAALRAATAPVP
jgi:hypothetical protein